MPPEIYMSPTISIIVSASFNKSFKLILSILLITLDILISPTIPVAFGDRRKSTVLREAIKYTQTNRNMPDNNFEVIIIGGSYAGLSAAMSLGRSLRSVLIIDSGIPCNRQTPRSHNFITQDGKTPKQIETLAKKQVGQYKTIKFYSGPAVSATKTGKGFEIKTQPGELFYSKKLIIATGLKDIMPDIKGFAECWGISVIHCPYCHGYEVKNEKTGILGNGDLGFELSRLISNWTKDLTIYTKGRSTLTPEQDEKLRKHSVSVVEKEIHGFEHAKGQIQNIVFKDHSKTSITAVYARPKSTQHSDIASQLGCEMTEQGRIKADASQQTTIAGVFACGDCSNPSRDIALAVSSGVIAGGTCNKEMILEEF
jgi:thioredoxin reductase